MSEEEKEAKIMLETFIVNHKYYNIKQSDNLEENINIILNLIEKQQKEIEELRKSRVIIDNYIDIQKFKQLDEISIEGKGYISKDKIREKIKEYEQYIDELHPASDCMVIDMYEDYIKAWKKLIGEDNKC